VTVPIQLLVLLVLAAGGYEHGTRDWGAAGSIGPNGGH